jgi:gliding motility-associated protein GldM
MAGGKLSARQRMINMMYLVLMALLALNVSKEILKSFHHMQVSFEESREKLETKIDRQIGALKKQAASDPTLAGYLSRTNAADALIDDFIVYVEKLEGEISHRVEEEEGVEPGSPSYMFDVEGSDNMEVHARFFVKDNDEGKQEKGFRGKAFKKRINDTRMALVALLSSDTSIQVEVEDGLASAVEAASALRAYEGKHNRKTWEVANLEHAPLGAVVALMAQIKNDARATQSAVTDILAKGTASIIAVESFEAVVKTKSSAVMAGQEYKAEIFLAAKTKSTGNIEFNLTKGGSELVIDGDRATYSITPRSQGTVEWGGYILMKTKKSIDTIAFNSEYQVFQVMHPLLQRK